MGGYEHIVEIYSTVQSDSYTTFIRKYNIFKKNEIYQYYNTKTQENIYIKIKYQTKYDNCYFIKWKNKKNSKEIYPFPGCNARSLRTNLPESEIRKSLPAYKGSYRFEKCNKIEIYDKYSEDSKNFYKNIVFKK
jgi:hypothetical protein